MVDEAVVWMVPLRHGGTVEHKGVLTLEPGSLVFTDSRSGERVEIPLADINKARRVRGSPILMVILGDGRARSDVAFYFAQPPPLRPQPSSGELRRIFAPLGSGDTTSERTTKRVKRSNVGYLSTASAGLKSRIEEWVEAIRAGRQGG
ncbi:MAG: hypothetical protein HY240_06825 [Actinobacteria bacterium]|nr:hypothetical protein [Actinomycetota bacterium]